MRRPTRRDVLAGASAGLLLPGSAEALWSGARRAAILDKGVGTPAAFIDNFSRSDQNLEASPNWTKASGSAGTAGVRSNALATLLTGDAVYQTPDCTTAAHYVQADNLDGGGGGPFLAARLADANNFLGCRYNVSGGRFELYQRLSGTLTLLGSYSTATYAQTMRLEVNGTTATLKIAGTTQITATVNSALTSTRTGIVARLTAINPWLDNVTAGAL